MELYFMRHGLATSREGGGPDELRPLVPDGIKKTQLAAEALRKLEVDFDLIVTSPLIRARQTADIVAKVMRAEDRMEELEELAGHPVKDFIRALGRYKGRQRLLLVGHQTQLGDTIAYLLGGNHRMYVDLKKSGICLVEVDTLPPKAPAILHWMLAPRHIKLMK